VREARYEQPEEGIIGQMHKYRNDSIHNQRQQDMTEWMEEFKQNQHHQMMASPLKKQRPPSDP